jgi:hypothetical protein
MSCKPIPIYKRSEISCISTDLVLLPVRSELYIEYRVYISGNGYTGWSDWRSINYIGNLGNRYIGMGTSWKYREGSLYSILGRGFCITGTRMGRWFRILGIGFLLEMLGNLFGFDVIWICIDIFEELVARREGFLALPIYKFLGNCMVNSQVNLILGFTGLGLLFLSKKTHLFTNKVSVLQFLIILVSVLLRYIVVVVFYKVYPVIASEMAESTTILQGAIIKGVGSVTGLAVLKPVLSSLFLYETCYQGQSWSWSW